MSFSSLSFIFETFSSLSIIFESYRKTFSKRSFKPLYGIFEKVRDLLTHSQNDDYSSEEPVVKEPKTGEGRVLRLLVENNGRMKQSELIEGISLEESRTNRLLFEMEEIDEVRMIPHGADTLVCRPGYEPPGQQKY